MRQPAPCGPPTPPDGDGSCSGASEEPPSPSGPFPEPPKLEEPEAELEDPTVLFLAEEDELLPPVEEADAGDVNARASYRLDRASSRSATVKVSGSTSRRGSSQSGAEAARLGEIALLLEQQHARLVGDVAKLLEEQCWGLFTKLQAEMSPGQQSWASADLSLVASNGPVLRNMPTAQSYTASQSTKKRAAHNKDHFRAASPQPSRAPETPRGASATWLASKVNSNQFEVACTLAIIANAIFFGAEAQYLSLNPEGPLTPMFRVVSHVFTSVFAMEIVARVLADGRFFCSSNQWHWNVVDTLISSISVAEMLLSFVNIQAGTNLTYVRIIRLARTLRIFRIVRILKLFTSLRILVYSVSNTLRSLGWTMVLLLIILYIFGLLFTQATIEFAEEGRTGDDGLLDLYYGSLFKSMYTLFKAITNGMSWSELARPLGVAHPFWEFVFMIFITFTYFAVLNVVTGVFCHSAIESANQDKDMLVQTQLTMTKVYQEQLERLFRQIDNTNSGEITLRMFEESLKDASMKAYLQGLDLTVDDAWNLFKLLDADESNVLDLQEFVAGCLKLRGRARGIDIHILMYESRWMMKRLADIAELNRALVANILLQSEEAPPNGAKCGEATSDAAAEPAPAGEGGGQCSEATRGPAEQECWERGSEEDAEGSLLDSGTSEANGEDSEAEDEGAVHYAVHL